MKQHITEEQLDEIFKNDDIAIRKFLKLGWGIDLPDEKITRYNGRTYIELYTIELYDINIGKMIEILENTGNDWMIGTDYFDLEDFKECILVDYKDMRFLEIELCDGLWKAVKEVIK